jgi:hypothetical protein
MSQWSSYSAEEVREMAQENRLRPLTDSGERLCASCGKQTLRFYYHELSKTGRIGTSYFWCRGCRKTAHSTGPRLSERYTYDDPFATIAADEFGAMEVHNWYDRLDDLWESKVLPQRFAPKA